MPKKIKPEPITPTDPNQRYDVLQASTRLRQSVAKTWTSIKEGKIKAIRDGGRTYIPGTEIIRASTLPA
jgi:hypothetical protein